MANIATVRLLDLPTYDEEEPEGFQWKGAIPGTDRKAAAQVEGHLNAIAGEVRMHEATGARPQYVAGLRRALNIFAERVYVG